MGTSLPTGTVTFLFTDIEGSTKLAQQYPDLMPALFVRHNDILSRAIESNHGFVFRIVGDSFAAAFQTASQALRAALEAQRNLQNEPWSPEPIKVRMGLHTGAADLKQDASGVDYAGYATLALTQRIMSAGHGGQTLISQSTYDLVRDEFSQGTLLVDLGEYCLKDFYRLEHLYQVALPGLATEFAPLKTLQSSHHNLPSNLSTFIGRERELSEIKARLENSRLLTLIGPGGTGKTRLALQLGLNLVADFADGVWLVELAPLADPALILQTVAAVFNLRAQIGMPLFDVVTNYLRAKQMLLILDNCEHLIEASARLADDFLQNAPDLKIIASSREALGILGETIYRVPSLSLPDQLDVKRDDALGFEAVQLFVERASAANPKFQLTDENASYVTQICSRLDGIPLAIELAASRMTLFTPEQIAARLDNRFKLLTGGSRTALPRQQTLRALIDWSYDILSEDERALVRRLSVFVDGWSFEAAEAIYPGADVLDLLAQLVNKSMVVVNDQREDVRYFFLETIRQYARDKLLESGEAEKLRDLHLDIFVEFAESTGPKLEDLDSLEWTLRLEDEFDNLRAALEWGLENDIESALRILLALRAFWMRRGYETEARHWLREALRRQHEPAGLENEQARQRILLRAKALEALTIISYSQGDTRASTEAADECVVLARQLGDKSLLATVLAYKAISMLFSGIFEGVDEIARESVENARESGEKYILALALGIGGQSRALVHRDLNIARATTEESVTVLGKGTKNWGMIMSTAGLGMAAKYFGEYAEARRHFLVCLPLFEKIGDLHRANMMRSELAHLDRFEGHYDQAEAGYRATIQVWQRLGHRAAVANQLECFAFTAKAHELTRRAARLFGAAEALREQIHIQMTSPERLEYDREVSDLKANMIADEFTSYWEQGRTLSMEQAIQFALEGNQEAE